MLSVERVVRGELAGRRLEGRWKVMEVRRGRETADRTENGDQGLSFCRIFKGLQSDVGE